MNKEKNLGIDEIFNLAFKDHKESKFKSAESNYNKILIEDPNHFNTLYLLGTLNFQKQKFGEAKKNFEKAILIKPNHAELCNNWRHINSNGRIYGFNKIFKKCYQYFT